MSTKRNGFTFAEIFITLLVIGVITVLSIQAVATKKTNFAFTCYHFLRDLKITAGHMATSTVGGSLGSYSCDRALDSDNPDDYTQCMAAGQSGSSENTFLLDYKTGKGFCQGLATTMASASAIKCDNLYNATLSSIYGSINSSSEPNFTLINKYLIYISDRVASGSTKPYRIVTADLNGHSQPNKTGEDIISFAVFDNGEVLPLGNAAQDTKYFMGVIKVKNILQRSAESSTKAVQSMLHPMALVKKANKKNLTFKEAYCWTYGSSENDPSYCTGYSSSGQSFDMGGSTLNVSICTQDQYNADGSPSHQINGQDFVAECDFNIIKPQVSKFVPVLQDVYSSKNNLEGYDDDGKPIYNQIYKY